MISMFITLNMKMFWPVYLNPTFISHYRLGHINKKYIELLHKDSILKSFDLELSKICDLCLLGKMSETPFTGQSERTSDLLGLVNTDVHGPANLATRDGFQYFIIFANDRRYRYDPFFFFAF